MMPHSDTLTHLLIHENTILPGITGIPGGSTQQYIHQCCCIICFQLEELMETSISAPSGSDRL